MANTMRRKNSVPSTVGGPFLPGPGLLDATRDLLGIAAIQYAGIVSLAWVVLKVFQHRWEVLGAVRPDTAPPPPGFHVGDLALWLLIAGSVALFWWTKREKHAPPRILEASVAYYVLGGLGISLAEAWSPLPSGIGFGISWVTVWTGIVPLVLPMGPTASKVGAFLCASTGPLALGAAVLAGHHVSPPLGEWVAMYLPNFLVALLAATPAENVYRRLYAEEFSKDIGEYELLQPLGEGGMGQVWIARHQMLSRPAAVKLIRPRDGKPNPQELERFEREAQAISTLSSPHTVTLYTFGIDESQRFFYVMELLDGIDLQGLVDEFGPLPPARVAWLLRQACHSLAEAHAHGPVHRDIKPGNLVACRLGLEHDLLKVLDFGLVKAHRVYALGGVAFFLLTGETVFTAETAMQMAMAHVHEHPDPPSALVDGVPEALDALVLELLAKKPDARPASAPEVAERLAALQQGWDEVEARAWWKDNDPTTRVRAAVDQSGVELVRPHTRDLRTTWSG